MRCSCCQTILTVGEMLVYLPNGQPNDICWSCQVYVDFPDVCEVKSYSFEDITEEPFGSGGLTKPKPLND